MEESVPPGFAWQSADSSSVFKVESTKLQNENRVRKVEIARALALACFAYRGAALMDIVAPVRSAFSVSTVVLTP